MDIWIDLGLAARALIRHDTFVLITDGAVGDAEEENLRHISANLAGEIEARRLVPFLTCKHSLEYCRLFAERAHRHAVETLTVVGGDASDGAPRCVPHAYLLRQQIRSRIPGLVLGGWVNLHRDPAIQADYLADAGSSADYALTQVVSHHDSRNVDAWLEEMARRDLKVPIAYGVFYYRNGQHGVLENLARYFTVPVEEIEREFEEGATPAEICARSILALRRAGIENVYICNLGSRKAAHRLSSVLAALGDPGPAGI
jgi:5,10-methylenetetrahydrofolate reductase